MIKVTLKHNFNELSKFINQVEKQTQKAMSSALNKALNQAKTQVSRQITELYGIKIKYSKRDISINRPNSNKLYGSLVAKGKPLPVNAYAFKLSKGILNINMGMLGTNTIKANDNYSAPFKAKISHDNGSEYSGIWSRYNNKTIIKTKTFTTKQGITRKITGKQQMTKAIYSMTVPTTMLDERIIINFNKFIIDKYQSLLAHEIDYFTSKI